MLETTDNNRKAASKDMLRLLSKVLICLFLAVTMVLPMAAPADVFATTETTAKKTTKYTTSKTQLISGINVVFDKEVIDNARLSVGPTELKVKGKRWSTKLYWTPVSDPDDIDGYIVVRRVPNTNNWKQIATVKNTKKKYKDKTAKNKNVYYQYSVLAYKTVKKKIMVSTPAGWAGGVTTRSSKKNVYTVKVSNPANVAAIMAGSCAQTYLTFPKKAKSQYIRWWSGNERIATVDANGLIKGIAHGKTTIYAKTHTGYVSSFDVQITQPGTAQAMIETFNAWDGYSQLNGKQHSIIDIYNSITPWPVGYKMKYNDAWCDATVTAAAIKTGNVERIGRECSVPRHIKIFKKLKIWEEDGTIKPKAGDIIVFSWNKFSQPNNASASHIGIVEKVVGNKIYTIEGNRGIGVVDRRVISVGWGCIRGYARPKYVKSN